MGSLLAVDVGFKTGLALFSAQGELLWYRSHNFGSGPRLKRGIHTQLKAILDLSDLVLEGGGMLAEQWIKQAEKKGIHVLQIYAEQWRRDFLLPRERKSGKTGKSAALVLARRYITESQAANPTSLRHDAAEAVLIGLWGAVELGLLSKVPSVLKR